MWTTGRARSSSGPLRPNRRATTATISASKQNAPTISQVWPARHPIHSAARLTTDKATRAARGGVTTPVNHIRNAGGLGDGDGAIGGRLRVELIELRVWTAGVE